MLPNKTVSMNKLLHEIIRIEVLLRIGSEHTQDAFDIGNARIRIIAITKLAPDGGMSQSALTDIVGGIDIGITRENE